MKKISEIFKSHTAQTLLLFFTVIGLVVFMGAIQIRNTLKKSVQKEIFLKQNDEIYNISTALEKKLTENASIVKNLALFYTDYQTIPERKRREIFDQNLHKIISQNKDIYAAWCIFKPYSIDNYDKDFAKPQENITGQFTETYIKNKENISLKDVEISDYEKLQEYLPKFRASKNILFVIPELDPYSNSDRKKYIARIIAPVLENGRIVGLVGIDIKYNNLFKDFVNNKQNDIFILNSDEAVIFSEHQEYIDKKIDDIFVYLKNNHNFMSNFALSKKYSTYDHLFSPKEKLFYSIEYIYLPETGQKWAILLTENNKTYLTEVSKRNFVTFLIPSIVLIVLFILMWYILRNINIFLNEVKENTDNISLRNKKLSFRKRSNKEMVDIQQSFIRLRKKLEKYQNYLQALNEENYDKKFIFDDNEILSEEISSLKKKLSSEKKSQIEFIESQKKEAEISKAIAEVNNIQREFLSNISELSYQSIKYIADFIDAVQGGLYIVNTEKDKKYLKLISFYSYNRRVYHKKEIEFGDGLAGTCAQEKKAIYSKVPDNYLEITSGLGKQKPNYIFLIPLVYNEELFGIIEFAFLNNLDDRFKDFLQTVSTILAATIATAETNERTERLLAETRKITEEMESKEAKMNEQIKALEELRIKSKIQELNQEAINEAINEVIYFAEFDTKANVLSINNNLSNKLEILVTDATLLTYYDLFLITDKYVHENYWKKVLEGKKASFELYISFGRNKVWFKSLLLPVYNINGEIYKVIFFGIDITEIKLKEENLNQAIVDLNEKAEQLNIQEKEMDDFFAEYEQMNKEVKRLRKEITMIEEEKTKLQNSMEFLQREFQKRFARNKKIERNLKNQIKKLNEELDKLKGNNDEEK